MRAAVLDPDDVAALRTALARALDGAGPPVATAPVPDPLPDDVPAGTALVLRTSGSTGTARQVALGAAALRASATATHTHLGGAGQWLLALPASHVAGLQVIVRAHVGGHGLVVAPPGETFTPATFAAAAARLDGPRRYVSLVPTQLHRLVAAASAGDTAGLDALGAFDAVLLGGAATPPGLLTRARDAGARVVTTYGMTETSGGCVYDGVALPGVHVRLGAGGVVEIGGDVLASGYVGEPDLTAAAFRDEPAGPPARWFRTSDLGALGADGTLTVLGRADDVLVSGGVNVVPAAVEATLSHVPGIGEACVVGVPDPEWGQLVVAVIAGTTSRPGVRDAAPHLLAAVRTAVSTTLGAAAAPRRLLVVPDLPRRGPGKVDRAAVRDLAVGHVATAPT
ncbi:AMP-binding protein [Oerskovia flava]|uniref:AMP-binding protein n=1 Tax=Oerskovia flava TaxID=2986422 RepID=UPI00223F8AFE|nr:AMP-binding protein [Oerskovia sp. JB1-3-2]